MSTNSRLSFEDDFSESNKENTMPWRDRVLEDEEIWKDEETECRDPQGEGDVDEEEEDDYEATESEGLVKRVSKRAIREVVEAIEEDEEGSEPEVEEVAPPQGDLKKKRKKTARPHRIMKTQEEIE